MIGAPLWVFQSQPQRQKEFLNSPSLHVFFQHQPTLTNLLSLLLLFLRFRVHRKTFISSPVRHEYFVSELFSSLAAPVLTPRNFIPRTACTLFPAVWCTSSEELRPFLFVAGCLFNLALISSPVFLFYSRYVHAPKIFLLFLGLPPRVVPPDTLYPFSPFGPLAGWTYFKFSGHHIRCSSNSPFRPFKFPPTRKRRKTTDTSLFLVPLFVTSRYCKFPTFSLLFPSIFNITSCFFFSRELHLGRQDKVSLRAHLYRDSTSYRSTIRKVLIHHFSLVIPLCFFPTSPRRSVSNMYYVESPLHIYLTTPLPYVPPV